MFRVSFLVGARGKRKAREKDDISVCEGGRYLKPRAWLQSHTRNAQALQLDEPRRVCILGCFWLELIGLFPIQLKAVVSSLQILCVGELCYNKYLTDRTSLFVLTDEHTLFKPLDVTAGAWRKQIPCARGLWEHFIKYRSVVSTTLTFFMNLQPTGTDLR